jgi:hypothetical protein
MPFKQVVIPYFLWKRCAIGMHTAVTLSALAGSVALSACTPTATPVATTSPLASASAKPTTAPTTTSLTPTTSTTPKSSADSGDKFTKVTIDQLDSYKHKSNVFEMQVPKGWKEQDSSKPGEVIVLWTDPSGNALIAADIFTPSADVPNDKLPETLEIVVKGFFEKQPGFEMGKPQVQSDGRVLVVFSMSAESQGIKNKIQGNSFIEKKGDKLSILTFGSLESQFEGLKDSFTKIADSQKISSDVKVP